MKASSQSYLPPEFEPWDIWDLKCPLAVLLVCNIPAVDLRLEVSSVQICSHPICIPSTLPPLHGQDRSVSGQMTLCIPEINSI